MFSNFKPLVSIGGAICVLSKARGPSGLGMEDSLGVWFARGVLDSNLISIHSGFF